VEEGVREIGMAESKPPEEEHQRQQPERVGDKDPAQQELRELKEREERANLFARHVEVQRTSWDTQFEITKHTSAGSGVLLLGLGALVGVFLPSPSVPSVAALGVVLLVVSFLVSLAELVLVRNIVLYQMGEDTLSVFYYGDLIRKGVQPDEEQEKAVQEEIRKKMEELPGLGLRGSTTLWTVVRWATLLTLCGGAVCFLVFALYNLIGGLWP
jgi:hypothetical protein